MKLSTSRITATHTIGMNVYGSDSFQVSFPKEIAFEGSFVDMPNVISPTVDINVNGSFIQGYIVGNVIKLGNKGKKGTCVQGDSLTGKAYKGNELWIVVRNRKGQLIHKQPLNKAAKIKDIGNYRG